MSHVDVLIEQWRTQRPDLQLEPMAMTSRLARVARHLTHEVEQGLEKHGLNIASFDVLATLRRAGPPYRLSPGQLIDNTMVTSGTMTNRIDQLVKSGLVVRAQNPEDGRSVFVELTARGLDVVERAVTDHVDNLARLTTPLSERDFRQLDRLLKTYLSALESLKADT